MPFYESVFIARQDVSSAQVDGLTENFEKIISDNGGSIPKKESWGLRSLAYRIKKNRKGYYVLLNIDAPPPAIKEMERQMQLNEDIIRYMTVRVDELEEGPSAIMRAKERGDERGGRRGGRDDRRPRGDGPRGDDRGGFKGGDKDDAKPAKAKDDAKPAEAKDDDKPAKAKADDAPKDDKADKKSDAKADDAGTDAKNGDDT